MKYIPSILMAMIVGVIVCAFLHGALNKISESINAVLPVAVAK